jgi:linoleoyl-CoA desaturase
MDNKYSISLYRIVGKIMNLNETVKIKFTLENDDFYRVLSKRVKEYLNTEGHSRYANKSMWLKTFIQFSIAFLSYLLILSNNFHGINLFLLQIFHGFFLFLMSIGIGHDGTHNAYSKNRKVNTIIASVMDLVGVDTTIWQMNHIESHHSAPNVPFYDSAIDSFLLFRFHPGYKRKKFMKYQHLYILFIYGLATLFKWFFYDFFSAFRSRIGNATNAKGRLDNKALGMMFFKKFLLFGYTIFIPIFLIDVPWYQYMAGFIFFHFISGIALGLIFQVTHLSDRTNFYYPDENGRLPLSFSRHLLKTTADFSSTNPFVTWISGGLNLHVAHHLFPSICQIHLPEITKIVKKTAIEFNVDYHCYPNMMTAFKSHLRYLKYLGTHDEYSPEALEKYFNNRKSENNRQGKWELART